MKTQRVAQSDFAKRSKRGALAIRTHDRAAPKLRIVNIDIFRRDVEIAADRKIDIFLFGQAIAQPRVPFQFIFISRRAYGLSVWRINGINSNTAGHRGDHARLQVVNFVTKRCAHVGEFGFRKDRDSVI